MPGTLFLIEKKRRNTKHDKVKILQILILQMNESNKDVSAGVRKAKGNFLIKLISSILIGLIF